MTTKEEENFRMDVESILFGGPLSKDLGARVEWLQSIHRRVKDGLVARANDAKKARDTALADLSQARAERDEARDTHARAYNAASIEIVQLRNERDAAVARAESAEASAAALQEVGIDLFDLVVEAGTKCTTFGSTSCIREGSPPFCDNCKRQQRLMELREKCPANAGRALLDRHAAELAQLREENARLRTEHPDAPTCIVCGCETVNYIYDYNDTGVMRPTCRDCVQALFGRAVAALLTVVRHAAYNCPTHQVSGFDSECDSCVAKNHGSPMVTHEVRAILADPSATAAADAYRAQQEERAELEAIDRYQAAVDDARNALNGGAINQVRIIEALRALAEAPKKEEIPAVVDARRVRGGR